VVSKAKRMVDASIALFARFGGNDRIADLLANPMCGFWAGQVAEVPW
jgi:hypothetical protein